MDDLKFTDGWVSSNRLTGRSSVHGRDSDCIHKLAMINVGLYPGGSIASWIMNPRIKLAIKSLVNTAKNIKTPSNMYSEMYSGRITPRNLGCRKRLYAFLPSSHGLGYEATVLRTLGIQLGPFSDPPPRSKSLGMRLSPRQ